MTSCAHETREWRRTQRSGGMIGESDRFAQERWANACTACGDLADERDVTAREPLLGSLIMGAGTATVRSFTTSVRP